MSQNTCFHCGLEILGKSFQLEDKHFCCLGCQTVFQILVSSQLETFYEIQSKAGNKPSEHQVDYSVLDQPEIVNKFIQFQNATHTHTTLSIPGIHCSACIWVLEQLDKLIPGIEAAQVYFATKEVHLIFNKKHTTLKQIASALAQLGYPPELNQAQSSPYNKAKNHTLLKQIAVAGFAFANCMLLSLPAYFDSHEYWILEFHLLFNGIMILVSSAVVFYSAQAYLIAAWKGVKHRLLTLDVPIALGILVLFITSLYNTLLLDTLGYFDSLTGFVFFLLLGKYIQTITYTKFSFERDYTSFFPLAIQKKTSPNSYTYSLLEDIKKGDELYLKPMEIIPVDGYLLSNAVDINYSFVTGESDPVRVKKGESVYAGGRIEDQACALVAAQEVIQSRLIQLWNQDSFRKNDPQGLHQISNRISSYFTPAILLIALIVGTVWFFIDPLRVFETTTAVLIVACPCALALSAPFVLSNMLRYFGRHKMYFKNTSSIERLAEVNHLVFDKTGTLTDQESSQIKFIGPQLNTQEKGWIRSLAHYSNHPLSVQVDHFLKPTPHQKVLRFQTELGQGISATVQGNKIRMGNPGWINQAPTLNGERNSWVAVDINSVYRGAFQIKQPLRSGLKKMFSKLDQYSLSMVSGDKKENKKAFQSLFDSNQLFFEQDPFQKINYIKSLQKEGKKVAMIGDGLNDAGALKQSDFGLAVALNSHTFTPACDAIVSGVQIPKLHEMLWAAKKSLQLIKLSFLLSLMYNLVGLYFAITGQLSPIIAAILMPLSSISVVLFASATTAILNKKLEKKLKE